MSRRERILEAALTCFLEAGYERTTVARIADVANVSNGAVFHHFPNKDAIAGGLQVEAIRTFQEGHHELLRQQPRSLRAAVLGTITHQLTWTEEHADLARFVYSQGHLDPDSPAGRELAELNASLAGAYRAWMEPLVHAGEIRRLPMFMITAIVTGPAHAIAQRWMAGQLERRPSTYAARLADAAVAGLSGDPVPCESPAQGSAPQSARVRIELVSGDGDITGVVETTAELDRGSPVTPEGRTGARVIPGG